MIQIHFEGIDNFIDSEVYLKLRKIKIPNFFIHETDANLDAP